MSLPLLLELERKLDATADVGIESGGGIMKESFMLMLSLRRRTWTDAERDAVRGTVMLEETVNRVSLEFDLLCFAPGLGSSIFSFFPLPKKKLLTDFRFVPACLCGILFGPQLGHFGCEQCESVDAVCRGLL